MFTTDDGVFSTKYLPCRISTTIDIFQCIYKHPYAFHTFQIAWRKISPTAIKIWHEKVFTLTIIRPSAPKLPWWLYHMCPWNHTLTCFDVVECSKPYPLTKVSIRRHKAVVSSMFLKKWHNITIVMLLYKKLGLKITTYFKSHVPTNCRMQKGHLS